MNSKKNSFKRVAAGALAVLTVAAYAAPVANVGGLPSVNILTADAADEKINFTFNDLNAVVTSISDNGGTSYNANQIADMSGSSVKLIVGKTATIKSKAHLDFQIGTEIGVGNGVYGGETFYGIKLSADDKVDAAKATENGYTINENYAVKSGTATYGPDQEISAELWAAGDAYRIALTKADDSFKETVSSSKIYTYTFIVPDAPISVKAAESTVTIQSGSGDRWEGLETDDVKNLDPVEKAVTASVKSHANAQASTTASTQSTGTFTAYQNETITLSSAHYFKAFYWNKVAGKQKVPASANYVVAKDGTGSWVIEIPAFDNENTTILVYNAEPTYTFTKSTDGASLKASGNGINATAASITATSVKINKDKTSYPDADPEKNALATGASAQAYQSKVTLNFTKLSEFVDNHATDTNKVTPIYSTLKITRNGKEISSTDATDTADYDVYAAAKKNTTDAVNAPESISFTGSGKYVVTYTVYVTENSLPAAKTLKYEFEIATKAKLTAKNVALTFTSPVELKGSEYDELAKEYKLTVRGDSSVAAELATGDSLKNKTVTVTAVLYDGDITVKDNTTTPGTGVTPLNVAKYTITGSESVSSVNKTQKLIVTYDDPEYSAGEEDITISWKVIPEVKKARLIYPADYKYREEANWRDIDDDEQVITSIDEIADLSDKVAAKYVLVNGDAENISYEYVNGAGAQLDIKELDTHKKGLPSAVGDYSVYVLYDGEAVAIIDVYITEHSIYAKPSTKQLSFTYGSNFMDESSLTFVNSAGKTVKNANVKNASFTFYSLTEIKDKTSLDLIKKYIAGGILEPDTEYGLDGVYSYAGNSVFVKDGKYYDVDYETKLDSSDLAVFPIPAGDYILTIGSEVNVTEVGKSGYSLSDKSFFLSVAKKELTEDMILITPKTLNGASKATITSADVVITDTDLIKNFGDGIINIARVDSKIASGTTSGKKIGKYTCNVAVDEDTENNYTGAVDCNWYIVNDAEEENSADIEWDDDVTTIKDNGSIYVKFSRAANLNGTVTHFGVICEKFNKLDAPKFDSTEEYIEAKSDGTYEFNPAFNADTASENEKAVQKAYDCLVYGGSIWHQDQTASMIKVNGEENFGMRINVSSADIGAWTRPYMIIKDNEGVEKLYYGEVRYLDLVDEVTDQLNLTAAPKNVPAAPQDMEVATTKDEAKEGLTAKQLADKATWRANIESGYRDDTAQFYVYGSYNLDEDSNMKEDSIQAFGLIIDKKGVNEAYDYNKAATGTPDEKKAYAEIMDKATKTLKLGAKKGFIEGKALKDNDKMDRDEFGAVINPQDAVTGVWIREYVDFGNNLVVYTEPVYIKSVSEQYANYKPVIVIDNADGAGKHEVTVTANTTIANATVKKTGVLIDKTGSLLEKDKNGYTGNFVSDINSKFISANAATNGYIDSTSAGTKFEGNVSAAKDSKDNRIDLVARPYVIYEINGKTVTIYGDPEKK